MFLSIPAMGSLDVGFCVHFDCNPSEPDVYYRGACEKIEGFSFCISENDFPDASPSDPVYIRLRLTHGALLCGTLVSPNASVPFNQPVHLAMVLNSDDPLDTLNIPEGACSLVRWVSGEPEFWLKITDRTSNWVNAGGFNLTP